MRRLSATRFSGGTLAVTAPRANWAPDDATMLNAPSGSPPLLENGANGGLIACRNADPSPA